MKKTATLLPDELLPWIACVGCGLFLPLLLATFISSPRYSELIEELGMALVLLAVSFRADRRQMPYLGIALGLSFGMSESFLYLGNYVFAQTMNYFFARLLLTVPMHSLTALIMGWALSVRKVYIVFGFIAAVAIHLAFNYYAGQGI